MTEKSPTYNSCIDTDRHILMVIQVKMNFTQLGVGEDRPHREGC